MCNSLMRSSCGRGLGFPDEAGGWQQVWAEQSKKSARTPSPCLVLYWFSFFLVQSVW